MKPYDINHSDNWRSASPTWLREKWIEDEKTLAEGLVASQIRYALSVDYTGITRTKEQDLKYLLTKLEKR